MMEMHTAQLPDGRWIHVVGSEGEWDIYTTIMELHEVDNVMAVGERHFQGIHSLASAELILEKTFGVKQS